MAARMEEAAKTHDVACAISGDVAQPLSDGDGRLLPIGHEQVKGISAEIPIFEYRIRDGGVAKRPTGAGTSARVEIPV